ncbi:unnamed protein product, partial [Porites evermanni]
DEQVLRQSLAEENNNRQVPFPVDLDVMEYISNSIYYQNEFKSSLENEGMTFDYKEGSELAHVECHGHEDMSIQALLSFLSNIQKLDVSVQEEYWNCVKAEFSTICSSFEDCRPRVDLKLLESEKKIRIVSCKSDISKLKKCLKNQLKKVKKEAAYDCETFLVPANLDPKSFSLLLKEIDFKKKYLEEECKDVEVSDDNKGGIRLKGPKSQVKIAMQRFEEQVLATEEKPLKLPQRTLEFLMTYKGQESIKETLKSHSIEAIVVFDTLLPSKHLSAKVLGYAKEAIRPIGEIADKSGSVWILTGVKDNVEQGAWRLQEFLDKNSVVNEDYSCLSREIVEYISKHCKEELQSIETSLEQFDVHFVKLEGQTFHLSGRRKGLQLAKNKLDVLIKGLVFLSIDESRPGLRNYFKKNGRGERWVKTLENEHKCFIQVGRNFEQKRNVSSFVTSRGHKISWKIGDIVKEPVDILVSPLGECTDAILQSSPQKKPPFFSAPNPGEICVLSGLNLPCNRVFLTSCSNWNGGSGEQCLRRIVNKSLQNVDELHGTSVAFPAIGTGNLRFPPAETARIMLEETVRYCLSNPKASVKDIRFLLLQRNGEVIEAFTKEMNRQQKLHRQLAKEKHFVPVTVESGCRRNAKMEQLIIEVIHGDLTDEESDAIVNIINPDMEMDNAGEVSKAISQACGSNVKQECKQMAPQKGGSVVVTSGGDLKVRHIIHLIPESSDAKHLQTCLEKCLRLADSKEFRSVSLPAIGTGGYGMSPVISANLIFQALSSFCRICAKVRNVRIVIKQMPMVEAFRQEQKRHEETSSTVLSTEFRIQAVRVKFTGKDKDSVYKAIDELSKDLSENCTVEKFEDEGISKLSESQINMLIKRADDCDVEMTVDAATGSVILRGSKDEVHDMTKKIMQNINQARETEKKKFEHENARMISKTIQWNFELQGKKTPFDFKANLVIEKAYSNGDKTVKVSSQGVDFVIDMYNNSGYQQPQNQQITVTRKLKEAEGTRFGQGVYFARDARLSLIYTQKSDALRYMYHVRVLVGNYCQGDDQMKVPPAKDPTRKEILYDSTVDKTVNPEQFVIYHDNQCYPEHLITFQQQK